jgi:putative N6-adenine-specific DNA methylase
MINSHPSTLVGAFHLTRTAAHKSMAMTTKPNIKALARRVKQHVIGRPQTFFAVVPPGLEALCRDELAALEDPPPQLVPSKGGVSFEGRLTSCYQANLMCRTASRILMRLQRFKARHFDALEERTRAVPWELYLNGEAPLDVRVSIRHSKLYHSQAVAERLLRAVSERLALHGRKDAQDDRERLPQCLWARLREDRITLSLDSSGDHLHKRGIKTLGGRAPLRETLAAAALLQAGFDSDTVLCDPMCGSGTFALEAAMIVKRIPPGGRRSFAFMGWPAFRLPHWQYLLSQALDRAPLLTKPQIYASDRSRRAVDQLAALLPGTDLTDAIDLQRKDFFDLRPPATEKRRGLITLNPPYGRRLGKPEASARLMGEILRKLQSDFRGWRLVIVIPEKKLLRQFSFPVAAHTVMHGGRAVWIAIGNVPS